MTAQAARAVALLDWLATRTDGACKLEVPEGRFSDASTVLRRFCERGQVGYVMEPGLRGNDRRRYFVRDLCPPGAVLYPLCVPRRAQLAADPKHQPQPRKKYSDKRCIGTWTEHRPYAPPATGVRSHTFAESEADYSRAKVTICPSGTDNRFTPERVTPFFAAGKRIEADTAIQRAYGGAK